MLAVISCLVLFVTVLAGSALSQEKIDYSKLDRTLKRIVNGKAVDYESLAQDHEELDQFIGYIMRLPKDEIDQMSENRRLAFWINSFNALTLKAIIDEWPIVSIKMIPGYPDKLWTVAGRPTTLDNIRMQYLGYDIGDPRVYLAACDGTKGSAPLKPFAYSPDSIQVQLDRICREVVNDPEFTSLSIVGIAISINSNLYWFREFVRKRYPEPGKYAYLEPDQAAVMNFVDEFAEGDLRKELDNDNTWRVGVIDYSWRINADKRPSIPADAPVRKPAW